MSYDRPVKLHMGAYGRAAGYEKRINQNLANLKGEAKTQKEKLSNSFNSKPAELNWKTEIPYQSTVVQEEQAIIYDVINNQDAKIHWHSFKDAIEAEVDKYVRENSQDFETHDKVEIDLQEGLEKHCFQIACFNYVHAERICMIIDEIVARFSMKKLASLDDEGQIKERFTQRKFLRVRTRKRGWLLSVAFILRVE